MFDGLILFFVNRNNFDLYLFIDFVYLYIVYVEKVQRDAICRVVMYVYLAKFFGLEEILGIGKDTLIFLFF